VLLHFGTFVFSVIWYSLLVCLFVSLFACPPAHVT
jgi:hypothetical protein